MPCPNAQNVDDAQKDMMARIIGAGQARGFSDQMIDYALKAAFIESSLGNNMGSPYVGSTSIGLFQYNNGTWNDLGHTGLGALNNVDNQIQGISSTTRSSFISLANLAFLEKHYYMCLYDTGADLDCLQQKTICYAEKTL